MRAKVTERNRSYRATGGGPSRVPQLTPLEERVASLLGRDVGPLIGVRQDPEIQIEVTRYLYVDHVIQIPKIQSFVLHVVIYAQTVPEY